MKILTFARRVLLGLAALAVLAPAAPAQSGRVQLALIADQDVVHRLDVRSQRYLGSFGRGALSSNNAVAVVPNSTDALVADQFAIKRFNVSTGRFLGTLRSISSLGGRVEAMRFSPAGALYVVVKTSGSAYTVRNLNPLTGATVVSSTPTSTDYVVKIRLGFRTNGNVEVFNSFTGFTYADLFNLNLTLLGGPTVSGNDRGSFRASSDSFLRITSSGQVNGGVGAFNAGTLVTFTGVTSFAFFAEAPLGVTYLLFDNGIFQLSSFETSGMPYVFGNSTEQTFAHSTIVDMTIYSR